MAETELELKLSLPEEDFNRFRRDPLIHRAKLGRARSKSLVAVYFDTPELDLCHHQTALRIRQEGTQRIQTLKRSKGGAGLVLRSELNAVTRIHTPDLSLIDAPEVRTEISELIDGKPLQPIFTTHVKRTLWDLQMPNGIVEVALDLGCIRSQGKSAPVAEIELELKSGTPQAILDLATVIAARYPIHIHDRSKAARGYCLFQNIPPASQKASKLRLDGSDTIWKSLGLVIENSAVQLFANEAAILEGNDITGIHQARVAVRRARAALSAFRAVIPDAIRKPMANPLQKLQVGLGPARDWDVFLEETLYPMRAEIPAGDRKALEYFIARVHEAKRRAYRSVFKMLRKPFYGHLQLALTAFRYRPAPTPEARVATSLVAQALLTERLQIVRSAAGTDPASLPEEALHSLRIDIKKFRYALDFLRHIYPRDVVAPWRNAAKDLQDCLGGLNDIVVQSTLLESMETPDMPVPKSVRRAVLARNKKRAEKDLSKLKGCWETLNALPVFWEVTVNADQASRPCA